MKDRQITIHLSADELDEVNRYFYQGHTHLSRSEAYRRVILKGAAAYRAEQKAKRTEPPWRYEPPLRTLRFEQRPFNGLFDLIECFPDGSEKVIGVHSTMEGILRLHDRIIDKP